MKNKNKQTSYIYTELVDLGAKTDFHYEEIDTLVGAAMLTIDEDTTMVKLDTGTDAASAGVLLPDGTDLDAGHTVVVKNPASANANKVIIGVDATPYTIEGEAESTTKTLEYGYAYTFTLFNPATNRWGVTSYFAEDVIIDA